MSRWLSRCPSLSYLMLFEFLAVPFSILALFFREVPLLLRHLSNVLLNSYKNILLRLCRSISLSSPFPPPFPEFVISLNIGRPSQVWHSSGLEYSCMLIGKDS
jgi:hypothetical protein